MATYLFAWNPSLWNWPELAKDIGQLKAHLAEVRMQPYAGFVEGYAATVIALKANEAITKGEKVAIKKEWLVLA